MTKKNSKIETSRFVVPDTDVEGFTVSQTSYGPMESKPNETIINTEKKNMNLKDALEDEKYIEDRAINLPYIVDPTNCAIGGPPPPSKLESETILKLDSLKSDCESFYLNLINIITTKENSMNNYMRVILTVAIFNMILMVFLVAFSVS